MTQSKTLIRSKEAIAQDLETVRIEPAPVFQGELPLQLVNEELRDNREMTVIGFDVLQVPRYKFTLRAQ